MSALSIQPTYPIFTETDGLPLENGYIWIGEANLDPQGNPINVYWDAALTIAAPQPIRTLNGYPSRNGTPGRLYVNSDYSIRVQNSKGSMVYSAPSATERYNDVVLSRINALNVEYDPAGTGAQPINLQDKLRQTVSVMDFIPVAEHAAIYDGTSTFDCSSSIQAAIASLNYFSSNDVGAYYGFNGKLIFPSTKGVFNIGSTITISSSYTNIDFGLAVIKPLVGFNTATFALNFTDCWQAWVDNLNLVGFTNNIKLFNNNLDSGNIEFDNVTITEGGLGFDIDCRSTFTRVMNYRFIDVKKAAYIRNGDRVQFFKGWYSAGVIAEDYGGLFELDSQINGAPCLELVDCFFVPTAQTVVKPCVVKVTTAARVIIDRGLFGGEPGAMTLINNFAQAQTYTARGVRFFISNTMFYTAGDPTVRLFALPNSVSFHNCNGLIEESHVYGLISYDPTFVSFAASKALLEVFNTCRLTMTGLMPQNYDGLSRNEIGRLAQYVNTPPPIVYNRATGVTNVVSAVITQLTANQLRNGGIWKIKLNNSDNPGADRYCEYVLSGDAAGTTLSLVSIILGSSTVAPRVSVSGSTFIILTNGSTSSNNFEYSLEKLTTPCEQYP